MKGSYKDTLLTSPGIEEDHITSLDMEDDDPNPEDKWYRDDDDRENVDKPFNPCPTISVSKEEFEEWSKPWKNALLAKVLGKHATFAFMEQRLHRNWEKKDEDDYAHALMEGPWMTAGHYLIVQRWRPFFLTGSTEVRKIAAWIRIPNLPIELYNHRFLWRVGSTMGHMLKVDHTTSIHLRKKFARICVEINLAKQLVPRISVLGCELNLEYEENRAGDNPQGEVPADSVGDENGRSTDPQNHRNYSNGKSNPDFGPWMLVKRYNNRKKPQIGQRQSHANQDAITIYSTKEGNSPKGNNSNSGSRFAILHEENPGNVQESANELKVG
ncbi:uncharacterized protein LOC107495408 [Arachis duranensis]|uniref:Uncharacterized protein LOC107495408 n=1 Tax=Arachis duranensis TaxID=130453 RepID=A0A6P4DTM0_ARADU|nr:uncharacterized protein LOC107495408 [Arachis duranensis]